MYIVLILIGFFIGAIPFWLIGQQRNKKLQVQGSLKELKRQKEKIETEIANSKHALTVLQTSYENAKALAEKAADDFYNKAMEKATVAYSNDLDKKKAIYSEAEESLKQNYLDIQSELVKRYESRFADISKLLAEENQQYFELHAKVQAAIEVNKRAELSKTEKDFYKLLLSQQDIIEIARIREIEPWLRDASALNKAIWSVYYKKAASDLVGRVVGNKVKTGIYKITNIETGQCYVGQSVDIGSRFIQHIKRGIGAESATRNKLYPAMKQIGPENFTFEIIEECNKAELNKKELEWQDFYGAKEFGYSER